MTAIEGYIIFCINHNVPDFAKDKLKSAIAQSGTDKEKLYRNIKKEIIGKDYESKIKMLAELLEL
jgi:hypothetical protein